MKAYEYILKIKDEFSKGFKDLTMAAGNANSGLDSTKAKMAAAANASSGLEDSFKSLGRTIATAFSFAAILSLGNAVWAAGTSAEQTSTAFTVLLGSADAAQAKLAELQQFADKSPFNTQETMDAGQALLGFGVKSKDLVPIMNQLGDISMGNANKFKSMVDNYGKIVSAQRANTQDLYQFANAGIPIWKELENATGKHGKELRKYVEENGVGLETINAILGKLTGKGGQFFEMSAKQSETTAGKWSTLVSKVEGAYVQLFNAGKPFLNAIIDMGIKLFSLNTLLDRHANLIDALKIAITGIAIAWGLFNINLALSTGLFSGLTFWQSIQFGLLLLQEKATWAMVYAQNALNTSMLASPTTWIVLGITALIAGFILAYNKCDEFRGILWGLWAATKQVFSNIGEFFKQTFEPIFTAITAFKEGRWLDAGKAIIQLGYNISPPGMVDNAADFAHKGGFSKGVKDQYQWAKAEGIDSKDRIAVPGLGALLGGGKTADMPALAGVEPTEPTLPISPTTPTDNSTTEAGGAKGKGINVITHLGGIKIDLHVAHLDEGLDQVEQKIINTISRIVNGGLYTATQ